MNKFGGVLLGSLALAISACGGIAEGSATPTNTASWEGVWKTNFGGVMLIEQDGRIVGRYAYTSAEGQERAGALEGKRDSHGQVTVAWIEYAGNQSIGSGKARYVMNSDGNSFSGSWGKGSSQSNGGNWSGSRTNVAIAPEFRSQLLGQ